MILEDSSRAVLEDYGVSHLRINAPSLLIMGEKDYVLSGRLAEYITSGKVKDFVPDLEVNFIPEGTQFVQ